MVSLNNNTKFKINNSWDSPENLNYDIIGLHKKRTIIVGELRSVEYYSTYDGISYSDLVVLEERVYTRDTNGIVLYRTLTVTWYLVDGSVGLIKTTTKYYNSTESIDEGITRRTNIIDTGKLYIINAVGQVDGFDLLISTGTLIQIYVNEYRAPLISYIAGATQSYLTSQMKTDIINILTF